MSIHPRQSKPVKSISKDEKVAVAAALIRWYEKSQRNLPWRQTKNAYAIWISEVMLQQTQVNTAIAYYSRFMNRFPDVDALAQADLQEVLKLWEGLGYYSRARNLHRAARMVSANMNGRLPSHWDTLRALPGIGDYTSAAVLSIAFGLPYAVVDGNVKRVLSRLFLIETPVNQTGNHKVFQAAADQLLDPNRSGAYNQAVMELGALVCTPKHPACGQCPLVNHCGAFQTGATGQFPARIKKARVPKHLLVAAVVRKNGAVLVTQRPAQGLLGGLWEFPCGSVLPGESPAQACTRCIKDTVGLAVDIRRHAVTVHHAYTHFKIQMEVFLCDIVKGRIRLNGPVDFKWTPPHRLTALALHKAVHKALPEVIRTLG